MRRLELSAEIGFAPLWLLAGALEAPTAAVMVGAPLAAPGGVVAAAHVFAAAVVFFASPRDKGWFHPSRHWAQALAVLTLLLPGIGWALAGWLVLRHGDAPNDKEAYRFDDASDDEDVSPLAGMGTPEAIRRQLSDALDVIPAVDALLSRTPELKRGAVETLARIRTPEAIAWIVRARSDPDAEVRFYVTTALTRLKRDFELAIQAAERESYRQPGVPEIQLALQRVRYEYAVSGIIEAGGAAAVLEDCRARLLGAAERSSEAARLLYLVEKRLDPARALLLLAMLESRSPERARLWIRERAELLFALGRHAEVAALLRERGASVSSEDDLSPDDAAWRSAALWWTA